jgi:hypothetical protein
LSQIDRQLACYQANFDHKILQGIRLKRTKLRGIVKHVIAPEILREVSAAIGSNRYSLLLDGSNSLSDSTKYLGAVIRYFDVSPKFQI